MLVHSGSNKKMVLEVEIEIDVPIDIVQDGRRIKAVEDGLGRSISRAYTIKEFHSG
ncbi:MAG TPA: hypothetical protein VGQ13_05225 [Nitrososphaera sp.]|jgi:hypothetical protein|nr:hypothetical protein [Nitrososphaera sp.]